MFDTFINSYGKQVPLVLLSCAFLPFIVPTSGEMLRERAHWLYSLLLASRYNTLANTSMLEAVQFFPALNICYSFSLSSVSITTKQDLALYVFIKWIY